MVLDSALGHERLHIPFTGIGSVRPLRGSSSFASSAPPHSTLNGSVPEVGWEPSTSPFPSSGPDDTHDSATNSSSSSAIDGGGSSANYSSSLSSSSAVYAIETVFTNSSAGEGVPESTNSSAPTNASAVEQELIETLEVDQQVTGEKRVLQSTPHTSCLAQHAARKKLKPLFHNEQTVQLFDTRKRLRQSTTKLK